MAGLPASIKRSPHSVDEYVPELVLLYKRLREEGDGISAISLHRRPSMFTLCLLVESVAEAETEVALPALKQLREFEQTTDEEIQLQGAVLQARLQVIEELREQALREGREEDAQRLTLERQELRAKDASLDASQLRGVKRTLDEQIEKHRETAEQQ